MPIYAANVEQYDSDTIIVIGGASQIGGITSNKIYSFSRSTPGYSYITLVIIGHISLVGLSFGSSGFKILNQLQIQNNSLQKTPDRLQFLWLNFGIF